jgi:hypothetical protein
MIPLLGFALLAAAALEPAQATSQAPAVPLRLHHLHYLVEDPAASMNRVAATLDGTRVLLQGLGVGVRVGDQYVLFDRTRSGVAARTGQNSAVDLFKFAQEWLNARGLTVSPLFTGGRLAASMSGESLDHIAFVAGNLSAAQAALQSAGASPVKQSDDALMYRTPGGATIELVRPTDVEETFWCPMHPDVRSGSPGACPLCGMAFVPIPPPRIGEYRMDVTLTPAPDGRGASSLRIVIRDPETGAAVPSFAVLHERPLHLFVVGRGLDHFAHVHPDALGHGTFELKQHLPPGEYMLIADFLPHGGSSQTVQHAIVTPGYEGPLLPSAPPLTAGPSEVAADGLRILLVAEDLAPRKQANLQFTVIDDASGKAVTDLEPLLGAPAHMLIVNADLTEAVHGHPAEADQQGSTVRFAPLIPAPGSYKLWVQFQRKGRVITAAFVLHVPDR